MVWGKINKPRHDDRPDRQTDGQTDRQTDRDAERDIVCWQKEGLLVYVI